MHFSKMSVVGVSVLLGCWGVILATPTSLQAQDGALRAAPADNDTSDESRLFIVTILPEPCAAITGGTGICRKAADCYRLGGRAAGRCAWLGLGTCCMSASPQTSQTCGSSTNAQQATFVNRNYPNRETQALGACFLTVTPRSNVCQLRLDLTEFQLAQPNNEGICASDYLSVTGGSTVPRICGDNTGQHLYVDVISGRNVVLDVISQSVNQKWNIKVTQIECNSPNRAPSGCLQYFTATSGTISSFNFGASASNTLQLARQSYTACIKPQAGYCSVTYIQAAGSGFSLTGDPTAINPGLPGVPLVNGDCTTDYIIIPSATILSPSGFTPPAPTTADRFCGVAFPGATSSSRPFNLNFVTNSGEAADGDIGNVGFKLAYTLNACR